MDARAPNADLGEILVFTRVVRGGSFTAAAASLGMPKSTVSRKIAELEARVGARLLQRTTRSVSLTDIGRAYYEFCTRIVAELEEAEQVVTQMQATPRGLLRIATPVTFSVISPVLADYMRLYPDVQVELFAEQRRVDLVEERFDLSLRAGASPDTTLVARKLGVVRRCVLAAPSLLERLAPIVHPSDLERHDALVFAPEGPTWTLTSGTKEVEVAARPRLLSNDYDVLRGVARAGFGLALLPEYQCIEDVAAGRLARALEGWSAREIPIFAMYPSTRHLPPKVIALLDLLRERLALTLSPSA
jgi:DNA-binding transcriptional LysR family regulator